MKYTFNVKVWGRNKKDPSEDQMLTNMMIDIDDYHSAGTAEEAEKEAIEVVNETKIREFHQARDKREISAEISLVKILKD